MGCFMPYCVTMQIWLIVFAYLIISSYIQIHRKVLSKFKCKGSVNNFTTSNYSLCYLLMRHIIS